MTGPSIEGSSGGVDQNLGSETSTPDLIFPPDIENKLPSEVRGCVDTFLIKKCGYTAAGIYELIDSGQVLSAEKITSYTTLFPKLVDQMIEQISRPVGHNAETFSADVTRFAFATLADFLIAIDRSLKRDRVNDQQKKEALQEVVKNAQKKIAAVS